MSSLNITNNLSIGGGVNIGGVAVDDFIVDSGTGYIRTNNGYQICWGRVQSNVTGAFAITFAQAFKSGTYPSVSSNFEGGSGTSNYYSYMIKDTLSNTGCSLKGYKSEYLDYVALGMWK